MANANGDGKALRFADLIRVSTEKQEKQGESLHIQRRSNEDDVKHLGGRIVARYGGQEHATPGYEKKEVDRLIADATKGKFDAVIVHYADRWSRDNAKSKEGLEVLRDHRIRFFVGTTEMDLFDPQVRFQLGMHAEVGEFIALQQAKKSLESKIERAKQGKPSHGHQRPFGRIYNKETGEWEIDPKAHAMIKDIAERLLAGRSLVELSEEYNVSHSSLWKNLRYRCGDKWVIEFNSSRLNIHEKVTIAVPRLLDEEVIKKIQRELTARRTYKHKPPPPKQGYVKRDYLLSQHVFCAGCGYALTGQCNTETGIHYYRHSHPTSKPVSGEREPCPFKHLSKQYVRADDLERDVIKRLFIMLGNPAAIERAIKRAIPDCGDAQAKKEWLEAELAKIERARSRLLDKITQELVTDEEVDPQLQKLKDRGVVLPQSKQEFAFVRVSGNTLAEEHS
jgi:DNA invertase Pin-like site-specific DNA recombinase